MGPGKTLIFGSLAAALAVFSAAIFSLSREKVNPVEAKQAKIALSMGKQNSNLEIVLIEDFQCRNCMAFSQQVIPKIKDEYIKTGKAKFTLIPVSFLVGSQGIANAVMEVHRQAPDKVFSYLEAVLDHYEAGDLKTADLVRLARRMGGIDLARLQHCIEMKCHRKELEENLDWARGIMGSRFRTPALYINGAPGSTFSFEAIQYQIDQLTGTQ
jgi:hypothetical protein